MAKMVDLRELSDDELDERLANCKRELFNLRFQLVTGQLDNVARVGQVRKDVARLMTLLREREIVEAEAYWGVDGGSRSRPSARRVTPSGPEGDDPDASPTPESEEESGP